jgi:hypothetical protein
MFRKYCRLTEWHTFTQESHRLKILRISRWRLEYGNTTMKCLYMLVFWKKKERPNFTDRASRIYYIQGKLYLAGISIPLIHIYLAFTPHQHCSWNFRSITESYNLGPKLTACYWTQDFNNRTQDTMSWLIWT